MKKPAFIGLLLVSNILFSQNLELTGSVPQDFEVQSGKTKFTFKIDAINWEETQSSVIILDGYFKVTLGNNASLTASRIEENAVIIQTEYGYKGKGVIVDTYHNGALMGQYPLFLNGNNSPSPDVMIPDIIDIPDEDEIGEEIEIELETEPYDDEMEDDVMFIEDEEAEEEVFSIVENMPEHPDGKEALNQFIIENLKYPEQAKRWGIQGRVFVEFVVDGSGKINNTKVVKGIGAGCDEEALRVINALPDFKPGTLRGKAVSVKMVQPVIFKL